MDKPADRAVTVDLGDAAGTADALVTSGLYPSLDAVLQEAVTRLDEDERALDAIIEQRAMEFDAGDGRTYTVDEVFDPLFRELEERRRRDAA